MNRTKSMLALVVALLAGGVGIGSLLRSDAPADDGALLSAQRLVTVEGGENATTLDLVRPVLVTLRGSAEPSRVLVRDENGLWAADMVHVDAQGERAISLVPGSYELVVRVDGSDERLLPLVVGAQETAIDLR